MRRASPRGGKALERDDALALDVQIRASAAL
jgi:hypothetical protein